MGQVRCVLGPFSGPPLLGVRSDRHWGVAALFQPPAPAQKKGRSGNWRVAKTPVAEPRRVLDTCQLGNTTTVLARQQKSIPYMYVTHMGRLLVLRHWYNLTTSSPYNGSSSKTSSLSGLASPGPKRHRLPHNQPHSPWSPTSHRTRTPGQRHSPWSPTAHRTRAPGA